MKFISKKEKLLFASLVCERFVGKKESLPILSCTLLEVGKNIVLKGTNLESGASVSVQGEVKQQGIVAVPSSILVQTLHSLRGEIIEVEEEGGNLLVSCKGTRTLIKAVPHGDFPQLGGVEGAGSFSLPRGALSLLLKSVSYACSSSMIRPELGSVYLEYRDGVITSVATDSFRLAEKKIKSHKDGGEWSVLLPLKHAQELSFVLDKLSGENVEVFTDEAQLTISGGETRLFLRVIDAQFPNYREIIPKEPTTEVALLKTDLMEVLRKARLFAGGEQRVGFHVYPKKKVFDMTAQSATVGEMSDTLDAALSGNDLDANFNIGYVADCLPVIEDESVVLGFSGEGKPLVMRGATDRSFTYLVMPLNR